MSFCIRLRLTNNLAYTYTTTHFLTNDILPGERERSQLYGGSDHHLDNGRIRPSPHTGDTRGTVDAAEPVGHTLMGVLVPHSDILHSFGLEMCLNLKMYADIQEFLK